MQKIYADAPANIISKKPSVSSKVAFGFTQGKAALQMSIWESILNDSVILTTHTIQSIHYCSTFPLMISATTERAGVSENGTSWVRISQMSIPYEKMSDGFEHSSPRCSPFNSYMWMHQWQEILSDWSVTHSTKQLATKQVVWACSVSSKIWFVNIHIITLRSLILP